MFKVLIIGLFLFLFGSYMNAENSVLVNTLRTTYDHSLATSYWIDPFGQHSIIMFTEYSVNVITHVYISHDFGVSYSNMTEEFRFFATVENENHDIPEEKYANIKNYYFNKKFDNYLVLKDPVNKLLFVSDDYGKTFHLKQLKFNPSVLFFHDYDPNVLIIKDDELGEILFSNDFGDNWLLIEEFANDLFIYCEPTRVTIYFDRLNYNGFSSIIVHEFDINKASEEKTHLNYELFSKVIEWEVFNDVLFVTQELPDGSYGFALSPGRNITSKIRAIFLDDDENNKTFTKTPLRSFNIIDAVKNEYIIVSVRRNNSNLCSLYRARFDFLDYTFNSLLRFNLILENVFCHYTGETWIEDYTLYYPFIDLYKVNGMPGTYIVTLIHETHTNKTTIENDSLFTLITWNYGGHWFLLSAPEKNIYGYSDYCYIENGCSLHLSIKYGELNYDSLNAGIMSSSSAPGLIIATGSIGKSLNVYSQSIYISRNGGVTWQQLFAGRYAYDIGDSGGVLIAHELTYQDKVSNGLVYYSIDMGHTWMNESLEKDMSDIHLFAIRNNFYKRSTKFSIFGLKQNGDNFIVYNLDLEKAFEFNNNKIRYCKLPVIDTDEFNNDVENVTYQDFHFWILPKTHPEVTNNYIPHTSYVFPYINSSGIIGCVLGSRNVYVRRNFDAHCLINNFNVSSSPKYGFFVNEILKVSCLCSMEDLECDIGYRGNRTTNKCDPIDPNYENQEIFYGCQPSDLTFGYYYHSTGMHEIKNDRCLFNTDIFDLVFGSYEICPNGSDILLKDNNVIIVAKQNEILRIDFADSETFLVTKLPINDFQHIAAFDFDHIHNCLFVVEAEEDILIRLCLGFSDVILHTGLWSVESIAYDYISSMIYIADAKQSYIDLIKATSYIFKGHKSRKRILDSTVVTKPRSIALDSLEGYLFWTDWTKENAFIGRSKLDGSLSMKLISSPDVFWPNSITVDSINKKIIWVDSKLEVIFICDYDCSLNSRQQYSSALYDFKKPFGLAIIDDNIFFNDWEKQKLIRFNLKSNKEFVILNDTAHLIDIKGGKYDEDKYKENNLCLSNPCLFGFCINMNSTSFQCMCADGFYLWENSCLCPDYKTEPNYNGTCTVESCNSVLSSSFICEKDNLCIPLSWKCNGYMDCSDGSDEHHCPMIDEMRIYGCSYNGKIIMGSYTCENLTNCPESADDLFCEVSDIAESCDGKFICKYDDFDSNECIDNDLVCDGFDDCSNAYDEENCGTEENIVKCEDKNLISCYDKLNTCYKEEEWCDGKSQCSNDADEFDCPVKDCDLKTSFKCKNGKQCVSISERCDGIVQCFDESDELDCNYNDKSSTSHNPMKDFTEGNECFYPMAKCADNTCIPEEWFCDGVSDCLDGSDEQNCPTLKPISTTSTTTKTTKAAKNINYYCEETKFKCKEENKCIYYYFRCDNEINCDDGSDEENCDAYGFASEDCTISVSFIRNNSVDFVVFTPPDPMNDTVSIMPLIMKISNIFGPESWKNGSDWERIVPGTYSTFHLKNLNPNTKYNVTVQFMLHKTNITFRSKHMVSFRTQGDSAFGENGDILEGNFTLVHHMDLMVYYNSHFVTIQWLPAVREKERILTYELLYVCECDDFIQRLRISDLDQRFLYMPNYFFKKGENYYEFVMLAHVSGMDNWLMSNIRRELLKFDEFESFLNITVLDRNDHSITIEYSLDIVYETTTKVLLSVLDITNDMIAKYVRNNQVLTEHKITINRLSPGTHYAIYLNAESETNEVLLSNHVQVKTTGIPFPRIEKAAISAYESTHDVHIIWKKPNPYPEQSNDNWIYGVFLAQNIKELYSTNELLNTTDFQATIKDVQWCRNYFWSITIVGPNGVGPMMTPLRILELGFNRLDAPLNVKVNESENIMNQLNITWSPSCNRENTSLNYIIQIENKNTSEIYSIAVKDLEKYHLMETCFDILYIVQIRPFAALNGIESKFSEPVEYYSRNLPAPNKLLNKRFPNGDILFTWEHKAMEDYHFSGDFAYNYTLEIIRPKDGSPIEFTTHLLSLQINEKLIDSSIDLDNILFRVALKTNKGCLSDWAIYSPNMYNQIVNDNNQNGALTIFGSIMQFVFVVLLIALIVGAIMYYRDSLQRFYMRFKPDLNRFSRSENSANMIHVNFPNINEAKVETESESKVEEETSKDDVRIVVPDKSQLIVC